MHYVYLCLRAEHRAVTVNGFLALQPPSIVRYRLPQCHACQQVLRGPGSIWHPSTHTSCRYATHSHFILHSSSGVCQSRWHGDPLLSPSEAPHTLMGVCVWLSWLNWPGSKPRGTGPPPPHHACFTLLIIFFNYLHHLFSITIIIYGRKMHKTSETIQQYVWVNDFQDVRVQKTHADWFSVRLHNNRKGSHLLHSSLYQRVLIHYIVCVFVCMHMRARLSCLRFHRVGKLIISPGQATMRFYPVPFLWRDISSSTLGFSIDYLTFSAFNII